MYKRGLANGWVLLIIVVGYAVTFAGIEFVREGVGLSPDLCEVLTVNDGDAYIGEDPVNPDWVWVLRDLNVNSATNIPSPNTFDWTGPVLAVENNFEHLSLPDSKGVGQGWSLLNNYVSIDFERLTVPDTDYVSVTIEYKEGVNLTQAEDSMCEGSQPLTGQIGENQIQNVEYENENYMITPIFFEPNRGRVTFSINNEEFTSKEGRRHRLSNGVFIEIVFINFSPSSFTYKLDNCEFRRGLTTNEKIIGMHATTF